jgi:hypothetical protein
VLRVEGASWVLEDLGSSNGTFLGPDRTQRVEIAGACEVRLGHQDNGPVVRFQPQQLTAVAAPRAPESGVTGGAQAGSSAPAAAPREPTLSGSVTRMKPGVVDRPTPAAGQGPRASARQTVPHRRHHRYLKGYPKFYLNGLLDRAGPVTEHARRRRRPRAARPPGERGHAVNLGSSDWRWPWQLTSTSIGSAAVPRAAAQEGRLRCEVCEEEPTATRPARTPVTQGQVSATRSDRPARYHTQSMALTCHYTETDDHVSRIN